MKIVLNRLFLGEALCLFSTWIGGLHPDSRGGGWGGGVRGWGGERRQARNHRGSSCLAARSSFSAFRLKLRHHRLFLALDLLA